MRIFLIRHGESQGNVDPSAYVTDGDPQVSLTEKGWQQAFDAGTYLHEYLAENSLPVPERVWVSSFKRTKQTLRGVLEGMGLLSGQIMPDVREDLRLAEQSFGFLPYVDSQKGFIRRQVGKALVAFSKAVHKGSPYMAVPPMGEAPITSYKRVDSFLNTLHRDREKHDIENILIVSHGATIKNFMMRWFHIPLDDWPKLKTPGNTDIFMVDNEGPDGKWRITRIYDGEKALAAHDNPVAGIKPFAAEDLPPLPEFVKTNTPS